MKSSAEPKSAWSTSNPAYETEVMTVNISKVKSYAKYEFSMQDVVIGQRKFITYE